MATPVLNPVNFNIVDTVASAQGVTSITINVGVATGGPYTTASFKLTAAEISAGLAAGTFTGTLASVGDALPAGNYFAVCTATNATGTSGNSPEAAFTVQAAPSPPTGFTLA